MYGPQGNGGGSARRPAQRSTKVTVPEIRSRKGVSPIAMVTAYDFTMARLLDEGGADLLLVGDSLGMVVQGHTTTLPVTVEEICYHGRAVTRARAAGARRGRHAVHELPGLADARARERRASMMKEGSFESIKLEGGEEIAEHVRRIVAAGIPVMGHLGLTPQSVHAMGGFKVQGKGDEAAERLIADARILDEAGAYAIVLEAIPPDLAQEVTAAVSVPTIGIGAGAGCDGQVLVCYDLLGMFRELTPKFAKRFAEVGDQIVEATRAYVDEVQSRTFPAAEHSFKPNGPRRAATVPAAPAKPEFAPADEIPPHWQTH